MYFARGNESPLMIRKETNTTGNMSAKKMKLTSASHSDFILEALRQIAPSTFTEVRDEHGELTHKVDFEALKELLGDNISNSNAERFGFYWIGKQGAKRDAAEPTRKTLRPIVEDSVDWDNTQNLYIEGDNLEVLKLLQRAYLGRVKMIYIDPPYNTGNDFVYLDDFSMSQEKYDKLAGNVDAEGKRLRVNVKTHARYHSDWCSMLYSRLLVARSLLTQDGVIFISIDDNEVHHLRMICDEVFGASNFVAELIWAAGRKNDSKLISVSHEYILCYVKSLDVLKEAKTIWRERKDGLDDIYKAYKKIKKDYPNDYEEQTRALKAWYKSLASNHPARAHKHYSCVDHRGIYFPSDISWPGGGGPIYDLVNPVTGIKAATPSRGWLTNEQTMNEWVKEGLVDFGEPGSVPTKKSYLKDRETSVPYSVFYKDGRAATQRLMKMFGKKVFENPKDEEVLTRLLNIGSGKDSLILDFFSGSATTAHAVMQLNAEDGGKRKYICVQLPDATPEGSEARKAGYDTICEIGKERIRKAGKDILGKLYTKQAEILSNFDRFAIGEDVDKDPELWQHIKDEATREQAKQELAAINERIQNLDTGFRVLRVDTSNMKEVYFEASNLTQDQLSEQVDLLEQVDSIESGCEDLNLLFECMVDLGMELSLPIRKETVGSSDLYIVNEGALVACFDAAIDLKAIGSIASIQPQHVLFRESCFATDADKLNIYEQFKQRCGWSTEESSRRIHII